MRLLATALFALIFASAVQAQTDTEAATACGNDSECPFDQVCDDSVCVPRDGALVGLDKASIAGALQRILMELQQQTCILHTACGHECKHIPVPAHCPIGKRQSN